MAVETEAGLEPERIARAEADWRDFGLTEQNAGEALRLRAALRGDALPPETSALDVLRTAWPPWKPGLRFDGIVRDDLGPALPSLPGLGRRRARRSERLREPL